MLNFSKLLKLQLLYALLGVLFNVVSLILIANGGEALTPNEPIPGLIVMTVYGLLLIPGFLGWIKVYRLLMVIAVILLGYGGVFNHWNFIQNSPELYHSIGAGAIGIGINVFGLILNVMGALGWFEK